MFTCSHTWQKNARTWGDFQIYQFYVRNIPKVIDKKPTWVTKVRAFPVVSPTSNSTPVFSSLLSPLSSWSPAISLTVWMTFQEGVSLTTLIKCLPATWIECSMHLSDVSWQHWIYQIRMAIAYLTQCSTASQYCPSGSISFPANFMHVSLFDVLSEVAHPIWMFCK